MEIKAPIDFAQPLLQWYETHRRDLPWRRDTSPYTVFVSEIMAQQTRIAQLLPFYERFIRLFPDIHALAAASVDDVLRAWAGMGYYARARSLHAAARVIVNERGGQFPDTLAGWLSLPGVGAYTAGAVMSIAYGARCAAVDGNVLRVYARLADDGTDIATPAAKKNAAQFIEAAMPETPADISRFSQALMELGALVCVPARPHCEDCPLIYICQARRTGRERTLPVKAAKKPPVPLEVTVLLIISPDRQLLMRRRDEKLLHGLWVYALLEKPLTAEEAAAQAQGWSYTVEKCETIGTASHAFTHRVWRMQGYALWVNETHAPDGYVFVSPEAFGQKALPKAIQFYADWWLAQTLFNSV